MKTPSDGLTAHSPERTSGKGPGGCRSGPFSSEKGDNDEKAVGMLFTSVAFGSNIALADGWPASVAGTWSVLGNQSSGLLVITSQGGTGNCRPIAGTIYGNSIQGFYCPFSGRIHFLRKLPGTNTTFQVWAGNLSQLGTPLHTGGVFSSDLDTFGEYNWQASFPVIITSPTKR